MTVTAGPKVRREQASPVLGGPQAWTIWLLATGFVIWLFSIQTGYAIVSPDIQHSAGLSLTEIGLAASVYTWTFALCQFFSGALLDRFGTRPLLTIAVGLVTAGAFLYARTTSLGILLTAQVVLALGACFGFVGAGYVGGRWFPAARYGLMFGLVQSLASLGSAVGQPVVSALLGHMTWQALLNGFGTVGLLLTLLFVLLVHDPVPPGSVRSAPRQPLFGQIVGELRRCLANRQVLLAALVGGASFGTMIAMGSLWGPRLLEARGADPSLAASVNALAWLGLAVGAPLANIVSNALHSRRYPAFAGLLLQAATVLALLYLPGPEMGVCAVLMFAMGMFSGAQMLGFTVAGESVPPALIGTASAIVNGVCFLIAGLAQSLPSWILGSAAPDLAAFRSTLWPIALILVLGALTALAFREPARTGGGPVSAAS